MDSQKKKQETQQQEEVVTDDFSLDNVEVPDVDITYQDTSEDDCEGCKI